jgi:IS30 family transposase
MRISHEAIYQALFVQGRGAPRADGLLAYREGAADTAGAHAQARQDLHLSRDHDQSTSEAADRAVPGHWEGDLILGFGNSAIGTLVERTTRFTLLLHLPRMTGHGHEARVKNGPALAGHGLPKSLLRLRAARARTPSNGAHSSRQPLQQRRN